MAEQPEEITPPEQTPDPSEDALNKSQDTIFNSEIGDDWGEAFEAEDFMFSPDEEASSEFFIGDDGTAQIHEEAEDQEISPDQPPHFSWAEKYKIPFLIPLLNTLSPFFFQAKKKFHKTSLAVRLAVAGNILLLGIIVALLNGPDEPLPTVTGTPPVSEQTVPSENATGSRQELLPLAKEEGMAASSMEPTLETRQSTARVPLPELPDITLKEKTTKKWAFPSFLIAATSGSEDQTPSLISINVTLEMQLSENEELPLDREIFVREIIYQFFNNRPLEELQRYSLARGEVKQKLKAWVEKQWPETAISAVILDRYQIL